MLTMFRKPATKPVAAAKPKGYKLLDATHGDIISLRSGSPDYMAYAFVVDHEDDGIVIVHNKASDGLVIPMDVTDEMTDVARHYKNAIAYGMVKAVYVGQADVFLKKMFKDVVANKEYAKMADDLIYHSVFKWNVRDNVVEIKTHGKNAVVVPVKMSKADQIKVLGARGGRRGQK